MASGLGFGWVGFCYSVGCFGEAGFCCLGGGFGCIRCFYEKTAVDLVGLGWRLRPSVELVLPVVELVPEAVARAGIVS